MADLASTRVFGKLTVMHDAILRANAEITGTATAASFVGGGSGLTALNASAITAGTVPNARLPATATRWPTWNEVTSRPTTFAPSAHSHAAGDLPNASTSAPGVVQLNNTTTSTSTTQAATAAAVKAVADSLASSVPSGVIVLWSGATTAVPSGWALCNGLNGTPNLQDRFVVGAGSSYAVGATGGADSVTLTAAQMPSHTHTASTAGAGGHSHTATTSSAGSHSHTGTASSAGAHTHTTSTRTGVSGAGSQPPSLYRTSSSISDTNAVNVNSGGAHTHSLSINSNGAHTHTLTTTTQADHTHTVSVGSTGSGNSHENRPPYYALAYIMKL